jgi:uncharacterized membrane protein
MSQPPPLRQLPRRTFDWLQAETGQWVEAGLLDEPSRARILSQYHTESLPHRGTMALTLIAVLMCSIGVLLVIGYNWERIPPAVKVAMVMASVGAAFVGAAAAYARNRRTLGEVLAFAGTLFFGNGIWLIAQVLHIQGHFPDAFLWFAIGAVAAAFLVESVAIGVGSAVLAGVWIISEMTFYPHIIYPFLVLWPCSVWVAYRIRSAMMVRLLGLTAALWVGVATAPDSHINIAPAAIMLTGCALYAIGRWHDERGDMADAWRMGGLGTLLLMIMPLMARGFYTDVQKGASMPTIVITSIAALVAASAIRQRIRIPADWAVLVAACVSAVWALAAGTGLLAKWSWGTTSSTIAFSATALVLCVALIRSAFRSNRTSDLAIGVLFGLAFLIVRWTSIIENLLWSGLLLLVTGGGLLFVVREWLRRDRSLLAERAS